MLMTHYREPIDFSVSRLEEAEAMLSRWRRSIANHAGGIFKIDPKSMDAISDDLNTAQLFRLMSAYSTSASGAWFGAGEPEAQGNFLDKQRLGAQNLAGALTLLGISPIASIEIDENNFTDKIQSRLTFLAAKNFAEADRIRDELSAQGIQLMDYKDAETGERKTKWELKR
jgi:cysteinyl-tRNA synthetase